MTGTRAAGADVPTGGFRMPGTPAVPPQDVTGRDGAAPGALPGVLRLGTRRSALATTQSRWVADRLTAALAARGHEVRVELVEVTTHGDVNSAPLASIGGTGVFVSALREALLAGEVDLAVHSLKDLPTGVAEGLVLAAVPPREDPRDALVARDGLTLNQLPPGARVGTGSPRRAAQLRALGYGLEVVDIRGNVDSRLRMVTDGTLDAVVLARAGLARLGRAGEITEVLDPLQMLNAPGQGALAVECRAGDEPVIAALSLLDDAATRACVVAERTLLSRLEAGCSAPVGALGEVVEGEDGAELSLRAVVAAVDGSADLRRSAVRALPGMLPDPEVPPDGGTPRPPRALTHTEEAAAGALGWALAEQLLADGAADLMPQPPATSTLQAREGDQ